MINENQEFRDPNHNLVRVLVSMLVGGMAGAVTMLLLAPKSGKDTWVAIQNKGNQLRDQTTDRMEDTMAQVRSNVNKFAQDSREKINEFRLDGQEVILEQFDHNSNAAQAKKEARQDS